MKGVLISCWIGDATSVVGGDSLKVVVEFHADPNSSYVSEILAERVELRQV